MLVTTEVMLMLMLMLMMIMIFTTMMTRMVFTTTLFNSCLCWCLVEVAYTVHLIPGRQAATGSGRSHMFTLKPHTLFHGSLFGLSFLI